MDTFLEQVGRGRNTFLEIFPVVLLLFLISRRGFSPSSCGVWLAREPVL
jgi:hypothetical protein